MNAANALAIVVAIERYEGGPDWDLPGPVADAERVINWLLTVGFMRANIYLLASPSDSNKGKVEELREKVGYLQEPHDTGIGTLLSLLIKKDMPKRDLMMLYWSGHGGMTPEGRRRLYLSDANGTNPKNVDVDELLFALSSVSPLQAVFLDSCANIYAHIGLPGPEAVRAGDKWSQPATKLAIYAASQGQSARNKNREGLFTSVLMKHLHRLDFLLTPEGFSQIANVVAAEFVNLREQRDTDQRPFTFYYSTGGDWIPILDKRRVGVSNLRRSFSNLRAPVDRKTIAEAFEKSNRVVIHGNHGEGKTEAARQYAEDSGNVYYDRWWCNAADRGALILSYSEFAEKLGKKTLAQSDSFGEIERWCAGNSGWLLILDGVPNIKDIETLIPNSNRGHVLITSHDIAANTFPWLEPVDLEMNVDLRARFLLDLLERQENRHSTKLREGDRDVAKRIAVKLTTRSELSKAAYHIQVFGTPLAYFEREVLSGAFIPGNGEWCQREIKNVAGEDPAAMDLVRVAAFVAPEQIPVRMLQDGANRLGDNIRSAQKRDRLESALSHAHSHRLIERDREHPTFSTPRDVQHMVKQGMDNPTKVHWWRQAFGAVEGGFDAVRSKDTYGAYTPHIQALIRFGPLCGGELARAIDLLYSAGVAHLERENYDYADSLLTSAEEMANGNDAGAIPKANILLRKADLFLMQMKRSDDGDRHGLREQALDHIRKALTLGEEQKDQRIIADSYYATAKAWWWANDHSELARKAAAVNFRRSYQLADQLLKKDDRIRIADILTDWGECQAHSGDNRGATRLTKNALKIRQRNGNPMDPKIASLMSFLADLNRREGNYGKETETWYTKAREIRAFVFFKGHPDLASIDNSLGEFYRVRGQFEKAKENFEMALLARDRFEETTVARTLNSLGNTYCALGNLEAAKSKLREAFRLAKDKAVLAQSRNGLGEVWRRHGEYIQAEEEIGVALQIRKELGDADGEAESLTSLGELARAKGNPEDAEKYFNQALEIREKPPGPGLSAADSYLHLAALYKSIGQVDKASGFTTKAREIFEICGLTQDNVLSA